MMKVVFTGGGSAGHVTPNVALIQAARERGWQVRYIGSASDIEQQIIAPLKIPYTSVATGKLRRYFSWQNFIDPFRLVWGVLQSLVSLIADRPSAVFSKGGFVSVPVAVAAWLLRIPVVSHESDVTPGLANKLIVPLCKAICVTFPETTTHLPSDRVVVTGTPVREVLLKGSKDKGLAYLGLSGDKPLLLVFGGSLGAEAINRQVWDSLDRLLADFDLVHVTGKNQARSEMTRPGYIQKEFIGDEFGDVMAAAEVVVSRAGANSLYELFLLQKPHLLIPLTRAASRGDQIVNAATFERQGYSAVIDEESLTPETLANGVSDLYQNRERYRDAMSAFTVSDSAGLILSQIEQSAG